MSSPRGSKSSPPGTPKRRSESVSFINTTNPEVLHIQPRPGGFIPMKSDNFATSTAIGDDLFKMPSMSFRMNESISREFKVQTALDETLSIDEEDATLANPVKDAMYMFGITISSLMMAASETQIPDDHLRYTIQCLECVKDDYGNHPPNVQGLLNHLKKMKNEIGEQEISPKEETQEGEGEGGEAEGEEGETIRTTTKVKMGNEDQP